MNIITIKKQWIRIVYLSVLLPSVSVAQAPQFAVDAAWPAPLPDGYILGQVSGIAVDASDHVWLVQRPRSLADYELMGKSQPPISTCCESAPSVLEFDAMGSVVGSWGGPGWDTQTLGWSGAPDAWPDTEHGINVDADGFVWLGGNGPNDHGVSKHSRDGALVLRIGIPGETGGSNDTRRLGRPADIAVDTAAHEVYIADGYLNRRVIVFDSNTGAYKRHWGAYGNTPSDADIGPYIPGEEKPAQFRGAVHSVVLSNDGLVYVADRGNDRIQVFQKDGTFVQEAFIAPETLANGSAWDLVFSADPEQQWVYLADGQNMKVRILSRSSLEQVGEFGRGGRQAGQFDWVHNIAIDSKGNLYTSEVNNGRRVQKFVPIDK